MTGKAIDLTGQTFGHLTVLGRGTAPAGRKGVHWECRCTCNRTTVVRADNLRAGITKSCGQCNALIARALRGDTARWHMHIWTADKMRMPSGVVCTYAFGVLRDPKTQALAVPLVKLPVLCNDPRTHALKPAFDAGLISGMKENRPTILRWLEEERVVVMRTQGFASRLEVIEAWEEISGLAHPDSAWMRHAARARAGRNEIESAELTDAPDAGKGGADASNEYQGLLDGWVA